MVPIRLILSIDCFICARCDVRDESVNCVQSIACSSMPMHSCTGSLLQQSAVRSSAAPCEFGRQCGSFRPDGGNKFVNWREQKRSREEAAARGGRNLAPVPVMFVVLREGPVKALVGTPVLSPQLPSTEDPIRLVLAA